ncbi:MAG TPA: glycosyltransferase [Acidimicrobiales bacterium]|nr:glycosyltransferase [Acidimicrobiales bacterium]
MSGARPRPVLLGIEWYTDNPGGLHRYLADLLGALRGEGAAAGAVVLGPATDAPVGVLAAAPAGSSLPRRLWTYACAARRAAAGADVVDAHFALFALWPVTAGRLRRLPLVVHFQGPWAEESVSDRKGGDAAAAVRRGVERVVYRRASEIIVLSAAFKRVIVERYGVAPWLVSVVPPGVDLARFSPGDRAAARTLLGLDAASPVAVAVRRLVPRTGVDVLLRAWADVSGGVPRAVLALVGDGPERGSLEALASRLGVEDSVRFLGVVDEDALVAAYRAADLAVVPSVELEGFGLVVLEALACGVPVLATDVGGLPEALRPLDPALVVPAGDAGALAGRLGALLGEAAARPPPERCRTYAEGFSWGAVARRHVEIYARAADPSASRKVRVVYLDHCARLSGGELALLRLLPALEGVDAHVILAEDGPLVARLVSAGISVEVVPMAERARGLGRQAVSPAALPLGSALRASAYTARVARRLRALRPDLVHTNSLKAALYGAAAGRLAGVPVVWHVRDRIDADYLPASAVRLVRGLARRLPAAVVANSRTTMATLGPLTVPAEVVYSPVHVHNGPRTGGDVLRVGIVGRIAEWKGQGTFLRAFAAAFPDGGTEAAVVGAPLFGEEDEEQRLRHLAGELGIADRVEFRGWRDDVGAELARLDVLVHASTLAEPFGNVVVEGMAAGLPVVAAGAGGPAEVITDGVDGLLYPPGDVGSLADRLRDLAADAVRRRSLGAAARSRAAAFAPPVIAAQLEALYRRVLTGRAAGGSP